MQSFSAGVGNWVADEILYQARIHPEQKANSLSEQQVTALHEQMQVMSPASSVPDVLWSGDTLQWTIPRHADISSPMQAVLTTAVEAGADSSRYPDSWIFHQKVGSKARLLCSCSARAHATPSAGKNASSCTIYAVGEQRKGAEA